MKRGKHGSTSIRKSIVAITVLSSLTVTILFLGIAYVRLNSRFHSDVTEKTDLVCTRLSETLSIPLWNYTIDVCERLASSEMADEDFRAVVILDDLGNLILGLKRADGSGSGADALAPVLTSDIEPLAAGSWFNSRKSITSHETVLGSVTVIASAEKSRRAFVDNLATSVFLAFAIGSTVALALLVALERIVTSRLLSLGEAVKRFAAHDFQAKAPSDGRDELSDLGDSFNLMAEAIRKNNDSLETLVKDRTDQLIESEKLAFLGSLVAGVAHEVNTPLGVGVTATTHAREALDEVVSGYKAGTMDEDAFMVRMNTSLESLDIVETNLDRAAEFIRTFKKLATDQTIEEVRRIPLKEYLEEIVRSLKPKLKHSNVAVAIDCPAELAFRGEPGAIYQIVSNLIVNSVVHAFDQDQRGNISITVTATPGGISIVFEDDGRGIPRDLESRVFEPFFTTRRDSGGTGLGLYIVRSTAKKSGGDAVCEGRPGLGARFIIDLPGDTSGIGT